MSKKVKVYTTSSCPYCSMVKSFLEEKGIPFEYVDVTRNKSALEEMVRKSGQMGVPVLEIEGKIIIGFNREEIEKELGL
ncbi:MAG: glutaredoxin family protein [Caldiserica bacterium]|nr:glutaredoxin family protein [Caldisericota bacterium]